MLVMALPVPTVLLDVLLSFSVAFSLVILLAAVFMSAPSEFSIFPSLTPVVTLIRLALLIASTRVILLNGNQGFDAAGQVIHSFGSFVVGNNFVVGAVVFTILALVNFFIVTRGAGFISESASRLAFNAMPGKQIGAESELNSGIISDKEVSEHRQKQEREAEFYRSINGSVHFARGDAIAGILLTLVNVVVGFCIGVFQLNMGGEEAARIYTLLAIGAGLAYMLPGLAVTTASGIAVGSSNKLSRDLMSQLSRFPSAFVIVSIVFFILALFPGLPHFPFFLMSVLAGAMGFVKMKEREEAIKIKIMADQAAKQFLAPVESVLPLDIIELEIGNGLKRLKDENGWGDLAERIKSVRRRFALDMGFIVPPINIRDSQLLKPNEYSILIKGVEFARGSLIIGRLMAVVGQGGANKEIDGITSKNPANGLPALWITPETRESAQAEGYVVEDAPGVISAHIRETIKRSAHELLGREEVQSLLDKFRETNPKVVDELVPELLSLGKVQKVLQNLITEQVSIRDLRTILERLADSSLQTQDTDLLTEYVRNALARSITRRFQNKDESISVLTLDKGVEDIITEAVQNAETSSSLALEPTMAEKLLDKIKEAVVLTAPLIEATPIILTSPDIRMRLKRLTALFIPDLAILAHSELIPTVNVTTLKVISLDAN